MVERSKFQFRMRDLLWAVSLIGMSLGLAMIVGRVGAINTTTMALLWIACYFYAAACFGAGVGCLFRRARLGAIWGILMAVILPAIYFVVTLALIVAFKAPL